MIVKKTIDVNDDMMTEWNEIYESEIETQIFAVDGRLRAVYTSISMSPSILSLNSELDFAIDIAVDAAVGSGWSIKNFKKMSIPFYNNKSPRKGSSYLPTPEAYNHPKCGLINIQNHEDEKCFYYSTKYSHSNQEKHTHTHRLTALNKIEDKYVYNFEFPPSIDDI